MRKRWAQCLTQVGWAPWPRAARPSTHGARLPGPLARHQPPLLHGRFPQTRGAFCSLAVLQRPGTKPAAHRTTRDAFATNVRADGHRRRALLLLAFRRTLRKPRPNRGAAGTCEVSSLGFCLRCSSARRPRTLSGVQKAALSPRRLWGSALGLRSTCARLCHATYHVT